MSSSIDIDSLPLPYLSFSQSTLNVLQINKAAHLQFPQQNSNHASFWLRPQVINIADRAGDDFGGTFLLRRDLESLSLLCASKSGFAQGVRVRIWAGNAPIAYSCNVTRLVGDEVTYALLFLRVLDPFDGPNSFVTDGNSVAMDMEEKVLYPTGHQFQEAMLSMDRTLSRQQLQSIVDNVPQIVFLTDSVGRVIYANQQF